MKVGGGWSEPVNLRSVNSPGSDLLPRFGPGGTLLFASSREAEGSQTDIYAVDLERLLGARRPRGSEGCDSPGEP